MIKTVIHHQAGADEVALDSLGTCACIDRLHAVSSVASSARDSPSSAAAATCRFPPRMTGDNISNPHNKNKASRSNDRLAWQGKPVLRGILNCQMWKLR